MDMHPLLKAIRTLPPGYQEFLDVEIPEIPTRPSDVDEAMKDCGQLAKFLINLFQQFEGLHLLKIPYYMGQGNEAVLGLLLSALETTGISTSDRLVMVMPSDGGVYPGGINMVKVQGAELTGVTVKHDTGSFELFQDQEHENIWSELYPVYETGVHTFEVTGNFADDSSETLTVSFYVEFWDTLPSEGSTYAPGSVTGLEVLTGDQTDNLTSVEVTIAGTAYQLAKNDAAKWAADVPELAAALTEGTVQMSVTAATIAGDIVETAITFYIGS